MPKDRAFDALLRRLGRGWHVMRPDAVMFGFGTAAVAAVALVRLIGGYGMSVPAALGIVGLGLGAGALVAVLAMGRDA